MFQLGQILNNKKNHQNRAYAKSQISNKNQANSNMKYATLAQNIAVVASNVGLECRLGR